MAWGDKKTTRDDTNHPTPRRLQPAGYAGPEVRAVDAAHEALKSNGDGGESLHMIAAHMLNDLDNAELRRMKAMEKEMDRAQEEQNKPKIEQIRDLVKALTYGEMMDVAQAWTEAMPTGQIDKENFKFILPPTLHAWATKQEG